jgi:hypothetical protein
MDNRDKNHDGQDTTSVSEYFCNHGGGDQLKNLPRFPLCLHTQTAKKLATFATDVSEAAAERFNRLAAAPAVLAGEVVVSVADAMNNDLWSDGARRGCLAVYKPSFPAW